MRQYMGISIFCLIVFAGLLSPIAVEGKTTYETKALMERVQAKSAQDLSSAHHDLKPRKKIKKKRTTILNRKTKRGHGHHCPSF